MKSQIVTSSREERSRRCKVMLRDITLDRVAMRLRVLTILILAATATAPSSALSIYDFLDPLRIASGAPAWGDLKLGLEFEAVERVAEVPLELSRLESDLRAGLFESTASYRGREIHLVFESSGDDRRLLASIAVLREKADAAPAWERRILIDQVKKRLPGLRFLPSRHAPDSVEAEVDRPMYVLPGAPEILVRVEPGYSLQIVYEHLLD